MKYPKRSQYQYAKSPYGIRNWPEYEAGLCRRGDLTVWLSDDADNSWRARPQRPARRPTHLREHRDRGGSDDPHGLSPCAPIDRRLPAFAGRHARGGDPHFRPGDSNMLEVLRIE